MSAAAGPSRGAVRLAVCLAAALVLLAGIAGTGMWATDVDRLAADEPQYLLSAISLATDGDLDIADELAAQVWRDFHASQLPRQTRALPDGSQLSPHNPLLPVLLVGPVLLADVLGVPAWVGAKAGLAVLAAALAGLLVWTAVRRLGVTPRAGTAVVTVFGTSPPLSVYATQLYPELPAALCVALVVAALSAPGVRWPHLLLAGVATVALPWLAVKYVPVAVLAGGWLLWRVRGRHHQLLAVVAALVAAAAGYTAFHQVVYGGWTPYAVGDHFVAGELSVVGNSPDYVGRSQRVLGLLVDRDFGLVPWQPGWLLVVGALGWAATGGLRRVGATRLAPGLAMAAAGWATATWVALTMHGWWWPGRQVVVVLPVLVLLIAAWAGGHRHRVAAVVTLGSLGVLAHAALVWGAGGAERRHNLVVDFTSTPSPVYQVLRPLFPALSEPSAGTAGLFAVWVAVVVAVATAGARSGRREVSSRPVPPPAGSPRPSPVR